jgi:hypothetical protein
METHKSFVSSEDALFSVPLAVQSEFFSQNELPPASENLSFPTQHGDTANAAPRSTHRSNAWSVALPHACKATPTSNGSSNVSIIQTEVRTFSSPALFALCKSKSALRRFISTATKRASGKRAASGSANAPLPAPKSTTVNGLSFTPLSISDTLDASCCRASRSSRSTVANDSTCHRFRRARRGKSRVSVFCFERAGAGAPPTGVSRASALATAASRPSCVNVAGSQDAGMEDQSTGGGSPPRHAAVSSTGANAPDASAGGTVSRAKIASTAACLLSVFRRRWRALCALCATSAGSSAPPAAGSGSPARSASSRLRLRDPDPIAPDGVRPVEERNHDFVSGVVTTTGRGDAKGETTNRRSKSPGPKSSKTLRALCRRLD